MFAIEIFYNNAWFPFDNRRFSTREAADAAAKLLGEQRPNDNFAVVGIF